jgi:hypothetical protein
MTPTQQAESLFQRANLMFILEPPQPDLGLGELAEGLKHMAVALRATYMKLEELEALIKRQPGARS